MDPWRSIPSITSTTRIVSRQVYIMISWHRVVETPDSEIPDADTRANYQERHKIRPELCQFLFVWPWLSVLFFIIHWSLLILNGICIILQLLILSWLFFRLRNRFRSLDWFLLILSYFLRRLIFFWLLWDFLFVRRFCLILIYNTYFLLWFNFFLHWFWFRYRFWRMRLSRWSYRHVWMFTFLI